MDYFLDFERPVLLLENQIKELQQATPNIDINNEIKALQEKVDKLTKDIYSNLSQWDRVHLSRHPMRPHCIDYIKELIEDFQ